MDAVNLCVLHQSIKMSAFNKYIYEAGIIPWLTSCKLLRFKVSLPEDEYKKHEKAKEYCHIVHSPKHNDQLSSEIGKESNKFEDPQKTKCSQNRETCYHIGMICY